MRVEPSDEFHGIKEIEYEYTDNGLNLKWRYMKACTYFCVVLSKADRLFSADEVVQKLMSVDLTDRDLVETTKYKLFSDENDFCKIFFIKEAIFQRNNRVWKVNTSEMNRKIPYVFTIFPCEYIDEQLNIYEIEKNKNLLYLPLKLLCYVNQYSKGLIKKKWWVKVKIYRPDDYIDGSVHYMIKTSDITTDIPLPGKALGPELTISLPEPDCFSVYSSDEMKKYFEIEVRNKNA